MYFQGESPVSPETETFVEVPDSNPVESVTSLLNSHPIESLVVVAACIAVAMKRLKVTPIEVTNTDKPEKHWPNESNRLQ